MSNPRPRAILATDLDGTLLRGDGSVSARTRAMLKSARNSEVEVVFVTGRPLSMLAGILSDTGHTGTVIGANGAVQMDASTQLPQRVSAFPPDELEGIWTSLARSFPRGAYVSMMWHPDRADGAGARFEGYGPTYPTDVSQRVAAGWLVYKLLVLAADDHTVDSAVAQAGKAIGDLTEVTHSSDSLPLVEFGPKGVTKGTALAQYADSRGLPMSAVHAIGDMPNDLPMLAVAGTSYAPANAHEQVRAVVDVVLGNNEADSVATLLEDLLARGIYT